MKKKTEDTAERHRKADLVRKFHRWERAYYQKTDAAFISLKKEIEKAEDSSTQHCCPVCGFSHKEWLQLLCRMRDFHERRLNILLLGEAEDKIALWKKVVRNEE